MKLVIAEKPSVGKGLADVLGAKQRREGFYEGNGYIVSWCVGHLVGLVEASEYDERYRKWQREDLPIIPEAWKYVVHQNKKAQFGILKGLMNRKDVESLVCATDAGREGELIFRLVYQQAGCRKPFTRLWISSMEVSAIKRGFEELRDGKEYDSLYNSALCRAKADWVVGINATRLFSSLYGKTLNVGRVQSPTLAMLVDRQEKIEGFKKEKYYIVRLNLEGIEAVSERIAEAERARQITAACQGKETVCIDLITERKIVAPPKLFDLTSLQRESNRLFGYTAKETLDSAQRLYELKLITYPRTDSRFLTSDMAKGLTGVAMSVASFICAVTNMPIRCTQVVDDKKVSDHHAIIPTFETANTSASALEVRERRIFYLIAARFLCALTERHEYDSTTVVFECEGFSFTAKGKVIVSDGWKEIDNLFQSALKLSKTENNEDSEENTLPQIMQGQIFDNTAVKITEHTTQPPKPFTENTLLLAMEKAGVKETDKDAERTGLGTPATRAAVIEKLVASGFVLRKGRQILPTEDGVNLIKVLPDILKSPSLTAEWENTLTLIAKGESSPEGFMRRIEDMTKDLVSKNHKPNIELKTSFESNKGDWKPGAKKS